MSNRAKELLLYFCLVSLTASAMVAIILVAGMEG